MEHQSPAPTATSDTSTLIKDTNLQGFGEDVITASMQRPVIVDFWADWCGPCKQLMPALEAAVTEAAGAVTLVKVNADQNQALCGQLQVQSLPTVLAFWQGQPVDGFQGAVPPSQIKAFIDRLIEISGGAQQSNPIDAALEQIDALYDAGEYMQVVQGCQQVLGHEPGNIGTVIRLGDALLKMGETDQAKTILTQLDPNAINDKDLKARLERLNTALELSAQAESAGDIEELERAIEADSTNYQARYDLALAHQAKGNLEAGADALLAIIMRDREWNEDAARKHLLKLFEVEGADSPFTLKYRRRLSSILFS
ncbi:tetratricopeptide repeat protein [Kordiimonas sp. SCSIO 12610]|uniref:tetratricopeptide repeat protein n=1 Tax=Kordiimonas sp. SCSIO 12610 TaxID=2829597 RepID=UPI00210A1369|nr:tetratricopeptide repeat protein [Kordiimonas sp. SCSIO 12610]UTW55425.1 tetratricopeptide repeat protein [Kordiimonas sp. SCSIO 12610]